MFAMCQGTIALTTQTISGARIATRLMPSPRDLIKNDKFKETYIQSLPRKTDVHYHPLPMASLGSLLAGGAAPRSSPARSVPPPPWLIGLHDSVGFMLTSSKEGLSVEASRPVVRDAPAPRYCVPSLGGGGGGGDSAPSLCPPRLASTGPSREASSRSPSAP